MGLLLITHVDVRITRQDCCCYGCARYRAWVSRVLISNIQLNLTDLEQ